jgi:alpha/beta superfamily hydrolase
MIPERTIVVPAAGGPELEAGLALPAGARLGVVVCHPHPRYGGNMDSPVVVTVVEAGRQLGLGTLRFNFRGVGASAGAWDEGRGERDDTRAAVSYLRTQLAPPGRVALAGYSFGAAMAAGVAAAGEPLAGLALIAPPLAAPSWRAPGRLVVDGPILIVAGSADAYCPPEALARLTAANPGATATVVEGADHFFSGGLDALAAAIGAWAAKLTGSPAG